MNKIFFFLIVIVIAGNVQADTGASMAQRHFSSIANGQVENILDQYSDNATLHWLGGPLDGQYSGKADLQKVWSKFIKALGPMTVKVQNISENANPKGSTITADVFFSGKKTIPVRYVLSYRDQKLINEIWQISPSLK